MEPPPRYGLWTMNPGPVPIQLVDRVEEAERLRSLVADPPRLVVVRGRRRIGKSHLLNAVVTGDRVVSLHADEQDEPAQLAMLAGEGARLLAGEPTLSFRSWDEALSFFATQAALGPLVLILDEFQYLCGSQPALPSIIQRHWDRWQREQTPIALILTGSALTFMEGLLAEGAPLFGRADYRPLLPPLDYRDASAFAATDTSPTRLIERYAILGGTPQYQVWAGARSLDRILSELVLSPGGPLYEEPLQLLRGEEGMRSPGTYFAAMRAVAAGRTRSSEIADAVGQRQPSVLKLLGRLRELGYLEMREPMSAGPADAVETARQGRGVWRIADPYFRFWFRYVFPDRSRLERGRSAEVLADIKSDLATFVGPVFEDCCRTWVGRYAPDLAGRQSTQIGAWWSRRGDAKIDVVAAAKGAFLLVGSCKWSVRPVDASVLDQLCEHRALLGGRAARARLALFSRSGFSEGVRARASDEGVVLVTAADLFGD